ncbi:hypothetical protein ABI59_22160 [Acidobacteria bacterium Mor1]|nr:hypothetical protein ABI59_22160 [Acidobacteria bacterium Mor1]
MLERHADVELAGQCANGQEALDWLGEHPADVLFLDVEMPGVDGMELLNRVEGQPFPPVVFVTAHDGFAVRAFEVGAVDYLLKPYDAERFDQALGRVRERLSRESRESRAALPEQMAAFLAQWTGPRRVSNRLAVKDGSETLLIPVGEIDWIESEANYVKLHLSGRTQSGRTQLARASLTELEGRLDPQRFVRIHRTVIVNVDRIVKLTPAGHGDVKVTLAGGQQLPLSRRYRERLEEFLETLG